MADLPDTSTVTKPVGDVAKGMKGSFKRLAAFAKKRPAIVALMVGAVVLVVWSLRRRGGISTGAAPRRAGEEDPLLELGTMGTPLPQEEGGHIPGAYPAPLPYYEPYPYYEPAPVYNPGPAYQDIEYGAAGAVESALSDTGLLDFLRLAREAGSDIEAPFSYGPKFSTRSRTIVSEDLFKLIPGGGYGQPGTYLLAPGEYRLKGDTVQGAGSFAEEIATLKTVRLRTPPPSTTLTPGGRRKFSLPRISMPRLTPKPTGTPTSGAKPTSQLLPQMTQAT